MNTDFPSSRDLVFIGGGHTHALVLRKWGMNPLPGVRLTLIDPAPTAAYSGMLPGFVAGHYGRDDLNIDLVRLARFGNARLILGAAEYIDVEGKQIHVPGRPPVAYDVVAIDVGITSRMPSLPGFADHGIPAKPLTPFAKRWDAYRKAGDAKEIAVIGGGVAGAELAMAMAHSLRAAGQDFALTLIDRSEALTEMTPSGSAIVRETMGQLGIVVLENAAVTHIDETNVYLEGADPIASTFTVGAAGAKPHDWIAGLGLDLTDGFLNVSPTLQASDPDVFATGDCAHLVHAPRTKAGVFAVRQAPVLFDNLVARLSGGQLRRYDPQKDYLKLVSLGEKKALAEKWGRGFRGPLLWRWKDQIDQKFMRQFRDLPAMESLALPRTHADGLADALGPKPMCGGCGAKVGRGALREALSALPKPDRPDILSLPGDDAAVVDVGGTQQVLTTDHLRAVTHDPVVMTRIAAHHALGDVWAMGAEPQAAVASFVLPRTSAQLQARTLAEMTAAAHGVFEAAGAAIVGGHSSLGAELTVGFSITGIASSAPITLAGAMPGDVLILTKPLGSGVILAAEMQSAARGDVVAHCLDQMCVSQRVASRILKDAHAMTDVTGFGLAGHAAGIAEASHVALTITLGDVPILPGALELAGAGHGSSLLQDNKSGAGSVTVPDTPLGELMFDPQTSGGLLAAVPEAAAAGLIVALQEAGYPAALIGHVEDGTPGLRFV